MTPHIESQKEDIAKIVIMPGDPLRAKHIAETFLENAKLVNDVRNMYGYTGYYKGKKITVFASGMGQPSAGIYSYELFKFYDVDTIIRVGTAGSYQEDINLYDIMLVENSYSESTYAKTQCNDDRHILPSDEKTNEIIKNVAQEMNINLVKGTIHSSDVFYKENDNFRELNAKYGCLACEMESFALFSNANVLGKKAAAIVTISDNLITHERASQEEREKKFNKMIELAFNSALKIMSDENEI